ncbi:MAG TPA: hypothetical protein HA340_00625, partial [Candidatus Thalassarchaeaceae archaeon]|nr:hypothetical protein [Candidatus Thalassarchaeaceae archaeon]
MSGDVNRNNIPSILVMIFILASLAPMLNFASEEAEASGGTRHVYTFIDGTTEAIAVYHSGQTATNVKVALPRGAEVTAVEMTLSGASSTGWNQIQHSSRSDWMSGTTIDTDKRSDSVSLGIDTPSYNFSTHGVNDESTSGGAWLDNSSFSIRQPRTSNASETRFTPQTTISSPFATYGAGATMNYRGWTYVSTFSGTNLNQLVKKTHPNNLTTATTVKIDEGSC